MSTTRKQIARELRDLFFFLLVSFVQTSLVCTRCTPQQFLLILLFTFVMWTLLWKGNSFLSNYLSARIPWIKYPLKRFLAGIVINITFTLIAVLLLITLFETYSPFSLGEASRYTVYGSIIITILISFFLQARDFLFFWRKTSFEKEKFEKESIAAQYESLKNQVSPHFLFNSLNALSNLVYEDPDKAVKFIKQLSEVYRYVLDTRNEEVVPLSKELKFLEAYLYLQHIRFGKKLIVNIDNLDTEMKLPPLALQMLIENAIKHNIISEEDPLTIRLYLENGFLVVENNLQRRPGLVHEPFSGVGLENIKRRYEFLSNTKVNVEERANSFVVKLPVLTTLNK